MNRNLLFVGIDVSKLKHDIAVIDETKKYLGKAFVIKDDYSGYQFLLNRLRSYENEYTIQRFYIGLEATADYWKNIYYYLKKQSPLFSLTVLNPVQTKAFAKTELRRAKTDPVNAKDIALFMMEKRPAASVDRPPIFDNIKDIDKRIYQIKKQQTRLTNKLRLELTKVAPEIEKAVSRMKGLQILALLEAYPTAEHIAAVSAHKLTAVTYGKNNWTLPMPFINKMKSLAQDSVGYKTGTGAGYVVQSLVRSLSFTREEVEFLEKQSQQLYFSVKEQDSLLATIPGVRLQTAIVLEAYIGDVNRFSNSKQIVAYFGMNPTVNLSGKSKRGSYLQKKGNPVVRHKLFMAVLSMISKKQEPFYSYYTRLVDAGKPKLVAIVATMRKLLTIAFAMLKNQEPFDEKYL
jgi:transposase